MQIGTVERQGTKLLETTSKQSEPVEDAGLAQNPFCKNMKSFILLWLPNEPLYQWSIYRVKEGSVHVRDDVKLPHVLNIWHFHYYHGMLGNSV